MKLYISEEDVAACLPMSKAIELVEDAFRKLADGSAVNQPRRPRDFTHPFGSSLHGCGNAGVFRSEGLFRERENRRAFRGSAVPLIGRAASGDS